MADEEQNETTEEAPVSDATEVVSEPTSPVSDTGGQAADRPLSGVRRR